MGTAYRAEHVGSLLRPPEVLEARASFEAGKLTQEQLRQVEDRAVLDALELQRRAGIEVFTDGELRRATWLAHYREALEGVVAVDTPALPIEWHDRPEGMSTDDIAPQPLGVGEKLRRRFSLSEVEAEFLQRHSPGQFKLTMPSPTMTVTLYRPGLTDRVYPTPADMVRAVADLQIAEIDSLVDRGVDWLQLDSLRYIALIDEHIREFVTERGVDPLEALSEAVAIDNELIRAAKKRDGVTVGLHICRGNNRSAWYGEGSYEPVAERLFGEVEADRFLLEYDTDRAGGFDPLRFVPPGRTVVLGLVSSKTPELESQDELLRRIDEAAKYVAMEDLALSPQCGFASTLLGNLLTVDDERRKLELVVQTAERAWG
jgi:5-methyltetrahydropteroyltriglutamate--homocysteine methyltransferase